MTVGGVSHLLDKVVHLTGGWGADKGCVFRLIKLFVAGWSCRFSRLLGSSWGTPSLTGLSALLSALSPANIQLKKCLHSTLQPPLSAVPKPSFEELRGTKAEQWRAL